MSRNIFVVHKEMQQAEIARLLGLIEMHGREIARLRAALKECAADFATEPGTVMSAQVEINSEFQRRMDIAGNALAHEQTVECTQCETPVAFGACCPKCGKPTDE